MSRGPAPASQSELDGLIPPEIVDDRFHRALARIAALPGIHTILDIGASSGEGSTAALVAGALRNPVRPAVHCIEVSIPRFEALRSRFAEHDFVHCHHTSSVPVERFATEADVDAFRRRVWTRFRFIRRSEVMRWLRQDIEYVERHDLSCPGIRSIMADHGIERFDLVVIDGSEFAARAELQDVYGARFIALDDVRSFKNHDNRSALDADPAYRCVAGSRWVRNGFAIYERAGESAHAMVDR